MLENGPEIGQNGMHNFKLVQYNKAEIGPLKAPKKNTISRNSEKLNETGHFCNVFLDLQIE